MIDLRDATLALIDFVPEAIADDAEIVALSLAIDPELRTIGAALIEAAILPRIADVPEAILDEIAWGCRFNELKVWDVATVARKRAFLVDFLEIRKRSGSRWAVERALELVGVNATVIEWWEEATVPFTYRITTSGVTPDQEEYIRDLMLRFAPARMSLTGIT